MQDFLECIDNEQLLHYLWYINILCGKHYGFRSDKNVTDVLFDVNKEINPNISKMFRCILLCLDMKKTFDSVDGHKLLSKLEC